MAEREYFSLRYLVPGFSFILIVIGMNFLPFLDFLNEIGGVTNTNENVFGLVLSLASLLASPAIGFLISQFWFVIFNFMRIDARIYKSGHLNEVIKEKYGLEFKEKGKESDNIMSAILDYLILDDEKQWNYAQRKWDIYLLMWCILFSLGIGVLIGFISRFLINSIFYAQSSVTAFESLGNIAKVDILLFISVLIIVLVLSITLYFAQRQVFREYFPMMKILIKNKSYYRINKEVLEKLFSDCFKSEQTDSKKGS
jgi:hypothetical protein